MNKAEIVQRLNSLDFDKKEYWLITGGAMVLYGMKEETGDIDLGCTEKMADRLEQKGYQVTLTDNGARRIVIESDIEIFENFLFDKVIMVENIPVISVDGLIAMKKYLGREKDHADIEKIYAFLKNR